MSKRTKAEMTPDSPLVFDPHINVQKIFLVGCGGTGAQWARSICRIVWDLKRRDKHIPELYFVDPDFVEEKNVGRQLFVPTDIGRNKAQVLAERFGLALGLEIQFVPRAFDTVRGGFSNILICGAVDSHQGRERMAFMANHGAVWIDCGNHDNSGQVVVGNCEMRDSVLAGIDSHSKRVRHLPHAGALFPDLLKPAKKSRKKVAACAEDMEAGKQSLLINDWMAAVAAEYTRKLLVGEPVQTFMTYVDGDGITVASKRITLRNLRAAMGIEEEEQTA